LGFEKYFRIFDIPRFEIPVEPFFRGFCRDAFKRVIVGDIQPDQAEQASGIELENPVEKRIRFHNRFPVIGFRLADNRQLATVSRLQIFYG
jgi:hypothetical protein